MTNGTKSEFTSHCRIAAKTNFLLFLFPARFAHARYNSRMIDRFLNWGDHGKPESGKIKGRCQPPPPPWLGQPNRWLRCSEQNTLLLHIHNSGQLLASTSGLVDEPTRDQNTLDLVLTTNVDLIGNVVVGEPFSDHNSITFTLKSAPSISRISKKFV